MKSFARIMLTAIIALGAAGAAVPTTASAQSQYYGGSHRLQQGNHWNDRQSRNDRWHGRYNTCSPREAVRKAGWMGVRRAGVARVNHRVIVVFGHHRGHRASVVFDRNSPRCRVIGSRGV